MRLFSIEPRFEGQSFTRDFILAGGQSIRGNGEADGWYIKFELPFKKLKDYINPTTFEMTLGMCRYVVLLRVRADRRFFIINMWTPTNE